VLFLSGAGVPRSRRLETLRAVAARFDIPIAVMGLGSDGAAMTIDAGASVSTAAAHSSRPVRSTLGAGDALAAGFLAGLVQGMDPARCLRRATVFAGHKVGAVGGTEGFLDADALSRLEAGGMEEFPDADALSGWEAGSPTQPECVTPAVSTRDSSR